MTDSEMNTETIEIGVLELFELNKEQQALYKDINTKDKKEWQDL